MGWKPAGHTDTEHAKKISEENSEVGRIERSYNLMDSVDRRDKMGRIFSGGYNENYDKINWENK